MNFINDFTAGESYATLKDIPVDGLSYMNLGGISASKTKGKHTVYAVIDTGVSPHAEFEDRLFPGYNANRYYSNPDDATDDNMHGTHVASTIIGKNVGYSPLGKVLPIKVLDGSGDCRNIYDFVKAINYAKKWIGPNGEKVNVINMSLGGPKSAFGTYFTQIESAIQACVAAGISVVCAAGNTGTETNHYPGSFAEPICVSSISELMKQSSFTTYGQQVDVCQIGENVIGAYKYGGYIALNGTSMATPSVSGLIGNIKSDHFERYGVFPTEAKSYEALKMLSRDCGPKGNDKFFGVGFATLQPMSKEVKLTIGNTDIYVDGETIKSIAPPILYNDRFYVSMRDIANIFGFAVNYDDTKREAKFRS